MSKVQGYEYASACVSVRYSLMVSIRVSVGVY